MSSLRRRFFGAVSFITSLTLCLAVHAQTNSWISPWAGKWEGAPDGGNPWLLGVYPQWSHLVFITNAGTKAVVIDADTVLNAPDSMTISNLTLWAPASDVNTLWLSSPGTATPLVVSNALTINAGGELSIDDGAVEVRSRDGGPFINDGTVSLNSGWLTVTNGTTRIGSVGVGEMTVSDGSALLKDTYVGYEANSLGSLTVAGGSNQMLGSLVIGTWANATGSVLVIGGQLIATNASTGVGFGGIGQMTVSDGSALLKDTYIGHWGGSRGSLTVAGGTNQVLGELRLGDEANSTGSVLVSGGQLIVTNDYTYVGYYGVGQMTVSNGSALLWDTYVGALGGSLGSLTVAGGTNQVLGYLSVGGNAGSTGSVLVSGGQLIVTNAVTYVGGYGVGQMTVSNGLALLKETFIGTYGGSLGSLTVAGGTNQVLGELRLGNLANSTGIVLVSGGQLVATNASTYVGYGGVGQMTVSNGSALLWDTYVGALGGSLGSLTVAGGTNQVLGYLSVGGNAGSTGSVLVSGGRLIVTNAVTYVGGYGVGQMTVSNGSALLNATYVGSMSGSRGSLTVAGGTNQLLGLLRVGSAENSTGSVLVSGGRLDVGTEANIGFYGNGTATVSNGLWTASDVYVGRFGGSKGVVTIAGGTNQIANTLNIGIESGATGSVLVTGGELLVTGGPTTVGDAGVASLTVSGGVARVADVNVGQFGIVRVAGGLFDLQGAMSVGAGSGSLGTGQFVGGRVLVEPTALLRLGTDIGTIGSLVTNQGLLQTLAGSVTFSRGLDNQSSYTITEGQAVNVSGGLANSGAIVVRPSGLLTTPGFTNAIHEGTIFLDNGANLRVTRAWTNAGSVELSEGILFGGAILNDAMLEGNGSIQASLTNRAGGVVHAVGGLLALSGASIQNQTGGLFQAEAGATLQIRRSLANQGTLNNRGGLVDLQSNMLTNQGQLTGYGTFKASVIENRNQAHFEGGSIDVQAVYLNTNGASTVIAHSSAIFHSAVTNASGSTIKLTGGYATFMGDFYNNGSYISDPATNTFNTLALGPDGALVGGIGDEFIFGGDLLNYSTNAFVFDISQAAVSFAAGSHTFALASADYGTNWLGYNDNFAIGEFKIESGGGVTFEDGNPLTGGAALYVDIFNASASQVTSPFNIYYKPANNPSLSNQTYALSGGGWLIAVPEPATWMLLLAGAGALASRRRRVKP